jgi:hypothetical protein
MHVVFPHPTASWFIHHNTLLLTLCNFRQPFAASSIIFPNNVFSICFEIGCIWQHWSSFVNISQLTGTCLKGFLWAWTINLRAYGSKQNFYRTVHSRLVRISEFRCTNFKITQVIRTAIKRPDIAKNTLVFFLDRKPKFNFKKCLITPRFYIMNSTFSSLYLCLHVLWTFMFLTATEGTGWK